MKRYLSIVALLFVAIFFSSCSTTKARTVFCPKRVYYNDTFCVKEYEEKENPYVLKSKHDYSIKVKSITKGCRNDYERICAIYKWICDNIQYDTSYEIYDADRCYKNKKGVCSAYCNLFYYMAKAAGVKTEIVNGSAKGYGGIGGHVWIFAYINKKQGILLDPTWGAGSVGGMTFYKRDDCWEWFNVDPKRMILTHFPEDETYQFLETPVSFDQFVGFPHVDIDYIKNGITADYIFEKSIKNELSLPSFCTECYRILDIVSVPMTRTLKEGETYTFSIRPKTGLDWAIDLSGEWIDDWVISDDGIYTMTLTISRNGTLSIRAKLCEGKIYNRAITYDVKNNTN